MTLTPGSRVGPYEVAVLLGSGGMANVYRARDTRLGRDVALKIISEECSAEGSFRERFEREARMVASLSHPNVVALYDVGFSDGKPYLVTELLKGETLRERLARGPIRLEQALQWAAQIAHGLAAAHQCGIVHRDLKLENVFITREGAVKLLDFGIAKPVEVAREPHGLMEQTGAHSAWRTGTGIAVGTPGYMAPEQVVSDVVDARADVFNLGTVLYEMLGGRPAFPAGHLVESGYAILHEEPAPLRSSIPQPVVQVVRRCLEKEPARRYQSARDLAFHLEILLPAAISVPSGVIDRFPPQRWWRRRWVWGVAAVLGVLASGSAAYVIWRGTLLPSPTITQMTFRRGAVSAARFAPDGRIFYSAAWGAEPEQLFARSLVNPDPQALGVTSTRLLGVSAVGELAVLQHPVWFSLWGYGGTLAVMPGAGGAPREVAENIVDADWSPTGELAVVRNVDGTRRLEYPLGTSIFESTGWIGFPRVSPNGETVAFFNVGSDPSFELLLVDRRGGVRHLANVGASGLAWAPGGNEIWFSEDSAIWASPLTGGRRLVYQGVSSMQLEDISADGKVLINTEQIQREMAFVPPEGHPDRELTFSDHVAVAALSDDGRHVLFTAYRDGTAAYLRGTGGSSAVKLGRGKGLALSPDGQWALVRASGDPFSLSLLPVGVGLAQKVSLSNLSFQDGRWLPDGRKLIVLAQRRGDTRWHLFLVEIDSGESSAVSPEPVQPGYLQVSRDGRFVAALSANGTITVYPVAGGPSVPIPELGHFSVPVGWTADGQLWASDCLSAGHTAPSRLMRYDLRERRVVEERTLSPTDWSGFVSFGNLEITPDGSAIAYDYVRVLGYLYLADGLLPKKR